MRRALVFAALLCACREKAAPAPPAEQQVPAAPERVREQEPNDFQRAQQIPARAVVVGTLQAPRDDDWYRVGAGSGKTLALRVELKGVRDAWLETYDRDRNRLLRVHAGGDDPGVVPAMACLEACFVKVSGTGLQEYELTVLGGGPRPGEKLEPNDRAVDGGPVPAGYYLVLKGKSRHGAPLAPYTLTATIEPGAQDLELEPNDDPEHATPLRETATGFLAPSGDQDWYRVHVDA